jgi:acyl carrier protein
MDILSNKELIRKFVLQKLAKKAIQMDVNDQDNLITTGVIDSLAVMQLVAFIEESFSIKVKDEDIVPENFESIEAISVFVGKNQ